MQPKIMITNGGPHPAEAWAELTAGEIIQIAEDNSSDMAKAGRRLELKIIDVLEGFYVNVQAAEEAHLDADGDGRLESPLDGKEHDPTEVVSGIAAAAAGTPFASHFARPDVAQRIRDVVAHHAGLAMDVSRSWYADGTDSAKAQVWKANRQEVGMGLAHVGLGDVKEPKK